jgi:hypothetical protein
MIALNRPVIQAFPINKGSTVGAVTDLPIDGDKIVHLLADANVSVNFGDTTVAVSLPAGMDFTIPRAAVSLTVDADCIIS